MTASSDSATMNSSSEKKEEEVYRPTEQESTAEDDYYERPEFNRRFSEQIVGGDEIEAAFSHDNSDEEAHKYRPKTETELEAEEIGADLNKTQSRHSSMMEFAQEKFGFFDTEIKRERFGWFLEFLKVWAMLVVFMLCIFSIYWGSFYKRETRYKNLKMLVVNNDLDTIDGIEPYLGQSIFEIAQSDTMSYYGNWKCINATELQDAADKHGITIEEEVQRKVHHQQYWSAIYVQPNATYQFYTAFKNANTSFDANGTLVQAFYETGRDLIAMQSYVITFVKAFETAWFTSLSSTFYPYIIEQLSDDEKSNLISSAPALLSTLPAWYLDDMRPAASTVLIAPYQVGSIYLIIITFFQFNFFAGVHQKVAKRLKTGHFILYRMLSSQLSFLVLSLGYSCVSAAFQVDFNQAYKGGFGVYWMLSYLGMSAVGGANENIAMIAFCTYPPFLGFWILSWVILNITPSFSAMALTSPFYRYGYAFPIHNSVEAMKVVLFNTYKGELGRNVGILIAWIVLNNLFMPFAMKFFAGRMKAKAIAEAKAKAAGK